MKTSKYDHTRFAVGKESNNSKKVTGFMYTHPNNEYVDINDRLKTKNKNIKKIYNIFNPIQAGTAPSEPKREDFENTDIYEHRNENYVIKDSNYKRRATYEKKVNDINKKINKILIDRSFRENDEIRTELNTLENHERILPNNIVVEEFVQMTLRKSLRGHIKGAILFLNSIKNIHISNDDWKEIGEFLNCVREDYNKLNADTFTKHISKHVTGIKRAISHQNIVVQPNNMLLSMPIPPKDGETEHKKEEKEAANSFLKSYANLDENVRLEYLRKLRRLIDLYFAAPEDYNKELSYDIPSEVEKVKYNIWERHENGKKEEGSFIVISDVLKNAYETQKRLDAVIEKKELKEMEKSIRNRNKICYRYSINVTSNDLKDSGDNSVFFIDQSVNKFWIHRIQNDVERILAQRITENLYKLDISYLKEKVWKSSLNYISIKYIAIGKAVYHFALKDILKNNQNNNTIKLGEFSDGDDILSGINSFDYEVIKAHETLQREIEVYVSFAVNNLARATVNVKKGESDIQLWSKKTLQENIADKGRIITNILQFFGGRSSWAKDTIDSIIKSYQEKNSNGITICRETQFLNDLIECIYSLRNESFHFDTYNIDEDSWNKEAIVKMFSYDATISSTIEKKRFHSNNLPMFYKVEDLKKVLDHLYKEQHSRASQVPSFNRVLPRTQIRSFLKEVYGLGIQQPQGEVELVKKWDGACYYLLKEVYYNDFLQCSNAIDLFYDSLREIKDNSDNDDAVVDFIKAVYWIVINKQIYKRGDEFFNHLDEYIEELKRKKIELSYICQSIMTEYNLQNNQKRKVDTANDSFFEDRSYKHYKLFLERTLRIAFKKYVIKEEIYNFIANPNTFDPASENAFLPDWKSNMYDNLIVSFSENPDLHKWYVLSRFLSAKMLNQLVGSMRSYIQYVKDVEKRASARNNTLHLDEEATVKRIEKAIPVVEMCIRLSNNFTNESSDYFGDNQSYAKYVNKYVDYPIENQDDPYASLVNFCNNPQIPKGIYADAENPIINRNIVMSKLFGPDIVLEGLFKEKDSKVKKEDLKNYICYSKKIEEYRQRGECRSRIEQEDLLEYQKLANKIELRDLTEYGELINDLLGQLINWSFLRERDLLYFQLGFHYCCLKNNSPKSERYKRLSVDELTIENGILNQIAAMYINGIELYCPKGKQIKHDNGERETVYEASPNVHLRGNSRGSAGLNVSQFLIYSDYVLTDKTEGTYAKNNALYNAGMEVFEVQDEHEDIVNLRNYIDHFKYYTEQNYSILDLYSVIFDRFFTYDMKYQKNAIVLLQNILAKHKVIINVRFGSDRKSIIGKEKDRPQIIITKIESDRFTHSYKDDRNEEHILKTEARNKQYLEMVRKILYHPNEINGRIACKGNKEEFKEDESERKEGLNDKSSEKNDTGYGQSVEQGKRTTILGSNKKNSKKGSSYKRNKNIEEGKKLLDEYNEKNSKEKEGFGSLSSLFANIDLSELSDE